MDSESERKKMAIFGALSIGKRHPSFRKASDGVTIAYRHNEPLKNAALTDTEIDYLITILNTSN